MNYWAAHPWKWDPSDSIPGPYRGEAKDTTVDVFFIHPTIYTKESVIRDLPESDPRWNASLNDEELNRQVDQSTILNQASAFNRYRVFAPRYRQAHLQTFYLPDSLARPIFDTAYADVLSAFEYYVAHYNQGRPFIIASHSQGTRHAARLIKERIEPGGLSRRLVAAYIIGLPVTAGYFERTAPCRSPESTGCFVSWRTYRKGYVPDAILQEPFEAVNINPLSFDMTKPVSERRENRGAILWKFNKPRAACVATEVNGKVLWCSKPRFFGNVFFTRRNYHIGDINLFWKDIRDNTQQRVQAYRAARPN